MGIQRINSGIFFPLLLVFFIPAAAAAQSDLNAEFQANPAAEYLPDIVKDSFNPDVTDKTRREAEPKRGGALRIRTPTDLAGLNAITLTGAPERIVVNHLSDSLVDRDPETLEYFGEMAWSWREADLIRRPEGEPERGRIVSRTEEELTFVPGAWRRIFNKVDCAEINEAGGYVVLKDQWGGEKVQGRVAVLQHTVRVDEGRQSPKAEKAETIPLSELATYDFSIGNYQESRPFAKENTVLQFHIRPGITWHDGEPFDAEDVKFSYETIMNPSVDCQHLRNYYMDIESCEVRDEGMTVRFVWNKTYFAALDFAGGVNGQTYFLPRHVFKPGQFGGDEEAFANAFNRHEFREQPVYTGPYKVEQWRRNDTLTLARNEDYWKNKLPEDSIPRWTKGQPYLDQISWVLYKEAAAVVKDLRRGALDVDLDVEPSTWAQQDTQSEAFESKMIRASQTGFLYTYIGWNLRRPAFRDERVRRALAMLIPRQEIADSVHKGLAFPVDGPFYVFGPGYNNEVDPIEHDPMEARKLLARAGWLDRDGNGVIEKRIDGELVPFEFSYSIHNARDYHQKIADIIKENVEQAGIRMTINKSEWANFMKTVRDKNFDAVRFAWGATLEPDPFQIWHSSQIENKGDNFVSYENERVDELCIKIRETLEPAERWGYAREVHKLIHEDQPYCFLFGFKTPFFIHRDLRGVKHYANMYPHDFSEWYWSDIPENRQ